MQPTDRTIQDYGLIARRRLPLIVLLCVIGALIGVFITRHQTVTYRANAAVAVNLQSVPNGVAGIQAPSLVNPDRYTATFAHIATSPEVAAQAIRLSRLRGITPNGLLNESSASPDVNANFVRFTVTTRYAERSKILVNSLAKAFLQVLNNQNLQESDALLANTRRELRVLAPQLARARTSKSALLPSLTQEYTALLTQQAQVQALRTYQANQPKQVTNPANSATRVQPSQAVGAGAGLVAGLLLGILIAFGLEGADKRVSRGEEVSELTALPLLGRVPKRRRRSKAAPVATLHSDASSPEVDAYYAIAARLALALESSGAKVIAITSSVSGEGKSTTAGNIAVALAATGRRVTLVDFDLRQPRLANLFDAADGPGVVEVVEGDASVATALQEIPLRSTAVKANREAEQVAHQPVGTPGGWRDDLNRPGGRQPRLCLLPAGRPADDAPRLIGAGGAGEILDGLKDESDFVIVDTPPLLAASDAATILRSVDGVVLVSRLRLVKRDMLVEAQRLLDLEPALKLGAIVNDVSLRSLYPGGYNYVPNRRGVHDHVSS